MLNPTEIHLLVGFLIKASSPDAVDIELGSQVHDAAADKVRDVDITLTCVRSPDDVLAVGCIRAIEVKRHRRPLTVEHVEQLSRKFDDMPAVSERWIVSASRYTDGAIKKGKAHGIDLLSLRPWDGQLHGTTGHQVSPDLWVRFTEFRWRGTPRVTLVLGDEPPNSKSPIERFAPVVDQEGNPYVAGDTFQKLCNRLALDTLNACRQPRESPDSPMPPFPVEARLNFQDPAFLKAGSTSIPITGGVVIGIVDPVITESKPQFRSLVRELDGNPMAGCAIAEGPNGSLLGVLLAEDSLKVTVLHIPHSDRLLQKITRRTISGQRED